MNGDSNDILWESLINFMYRQCFYRRDKYTKEMSQTNAYILTTQLCPGWWWHHKDINHLEAFADLYNLTTCYLSHLSFLNPLDIGKRLAA